MIERIRTYLLEHELDEPIGFSQWYYSKRNALLIEVVDSSGASRSRLWTGGGDANGSRAVLCAVLIGYTLKMSVYGVCVGMHRMILRYR